jgi:hypothetical protein
VRLVAQGQRHFSVAWLLAAKIRMAAHSLALDDPAVLFAEGRMSLLPRVECPFYRESASPFTASRLVP